MTRLKLSLLLLLSSVTATDGIDRTIDGSNNNPNHTHWGQANSLYKRMLPPKYDDDQFIPAGTTSFRRFLRPNARTVSQQILKNPNSLIVKTNFSEMVAWWGVFISHDITMSLDSGLGANCSGIHHFDKCSNILLPDGDDELNATHGFLPQTRTLYTTVNKSHNMVRQQMNAITSYLDASTVYGSDNATNNLVRNLKTGELLLPGGLLPHDKTNTHMLCLAQNPKKTPCFLAGDKRANVVIPLTALHTLFADLHNRLVAQFKKLQPKATATQLYNSARKTVGAIVQKITYDEWLPIVLGDSVAKQINGPYAYNNTVDATIYNSVAAAALRFGHSIVSQNISQSDANFTKVKSILLRDALFSPQTITTPMNLHYTLRGAMKQSLKARTNIIHAITCCIVEVNNPATLTMDLTNKLFEHLYGFPLDLAAFNIQRGREHGLPSYYDFRTSFNFTAGTILPPNRKLLHKVYRQDNADKLDMTMDLWVGGLFENTVTGALVGPTFQELLKKQFYNLRYGDRFWYEGKDVLSAQQMSIVKQSTLAKLIQDFTRHTGAFPKDAFRTS